MKLLIILGLIFLVLISIFFGLLIISAIVALFSEVVENFTVLKMKKEKYKNSNKS